MKKNLLMLLAICLLVIPARANELAEALCADEVFTAMVKEGEEVACQVKLMSTTERAIWFKSSEFAQFRESHARNLAYLNLVYKVFDREAGQVALTQAVSMVATDPAVCEWYFQVEYFNCYTINDPFAREWCISEAVRRYNQCLGGPIES